MNTYPLLSDTLCRRGLMLCLALFTLAGCASKKHKDPWDDEPPIWKRKAPIDPVEQRVFYSGWRHPT